MGFDKATRRLRIKRSIRKKISGTPERPRLSVYRSNSYIYCQLVDDQSGVTLAAASSRLKDISTQKVPKAEKGKLVGKRIAELAKEKGISNVVFDRNGFQYHGRIQALCEGAREGGLQF